MWEEELKENFIPIQSGYVGIKVGSKYQKENAFKSLEYFIRSTIQQMIPKKKKIKGLIEARGLLLDDLFNEGWNACIDEMKKNVS